MIAETIEIINDDLTISEVEIIKRAIRCINHVRRKTGRPKLLYKHTISEKSPQKGE